MKNYLHCFDAKGKDDITTGKRYEIVGIDMCCGNPCYVIIDDAGDRSYWPIEIDSEGESYRDWFKLVKEAEVIETASENVTVLAEELGLQREYREVKRKARVGERIKITAEEMLGEHRKGEIYTVTSAAGDPVHTDGKWDDGSTLNPWDEHYVVLEPTDIVRIDGAQGTVGPSVERYRMVERKADVGERVVIVGNTTRHCFPLGTTTLIQDKSHRRVRGEDYYNGWLDHDDYRVLVPIQALAHEPLAPAQQTQAEHSDVAELVRKSHEQQAQIDGLTETVANLARRLSKAESALYDVGLDVRLIEDGVSEDIRKLKERVAELERGQAPEEAPEPAAVKNLTRDGVIEKAKVDVADLKHIGNTAFRDLPDKSPLHDRYYVVRFEINRKKRTVVALVSLRSKEEIVAKGIAKCAPTDCFNVYIGMAIALRRALGLDIPQEYVNAPHPEEVNVGDVVEARYDDGVLAFITELTRRNKAFDQWGYGKAFQYTHDDGWVGERQLHVIDDSRDGRYGEVYSV